MEITAEQVQEINNARGEIDAVNGRLYMAVCALRNVTACCTTEFDADETGNIEILNIVREHFERVLDENDKAVSALFAAVRGLSGGDL